MANPILVLGKDGQLGRAFMALLGDKALGLSREQCDLSKPNFIDSLTSFLSYPIGAVINATAYTAVDKAETSERDTALRVNGAAVGELAVWCKANDLPLVHFSTDYVFDGSGTLPKKETDTPNPLSVYGASKLAGERAIIDTGGRYLIFRTSWVYDAQGKNFFTTIRRLLREKETLNIVADQVGAPTYAPHLAKASFDGLQHALALPQFPSGLYHLCSGGNTSWFGFTQAILATEQVAGEPLTCHSVSAIPSSEYPLPAKRPLNSRLDCWQARKKLQVIMPSWEDGLRDCFAALPLGVE